MEKLFSASDLETLNGKDIKDITFFDMKYLQFLNCQRFFFRFVYKRETMIASIDVYFSQGNLDNMSFTPAEDEDSLFLFRKIGRPFEEKKIEIKKAVKELLKEKKIYTGPF